MDKDQILDDELLDDEEEMTDVEEMHDPENAEPKSVDSVRKAAQTGPKGKKRHADKDNKENGGKAYKPNKGFVRELYAKMDEMTAEDVRALHAIIMDDDFSVDSLVSEDAEDTLADVSYDMSEDLTDLVSEEATLSEGFKDKASVIMEMAVKSKVKEEIARLEEAYEEQIDEAKDEMVEKIDSYLNYVVENWMEENKLAVQTGLRTEIAEGFMNGLKDLFTESYITVPEEKVDLVDDLAEQNEALEAELNKLVESRMADAEELEMFRRERVIFEMSEDLADTQVDKLVKLSENVDFDDEDTFRESIATIKETYFGKKTPTNTQSEIHEDVDGSDDDDTVEISGSMARYVDALKRSK